MTNQRPSSEHQFENIPELFALLLHPTVPHPLLDPSIEFPLGKIIFQLFSTRTLCPNGPVQNVPVVSIVKVSISIFIVEVSVTLL